MFTVTTGGDFVKRKLSPWCKEVKKTLIDRDMTVTDLCDQVGMCRNYVSRTINGASYAPALAETISKAYLFMRNNPEETDIEFRLNGSKLEYKWRERD